VQPVELTGPFWPPAIIAGSGIPKVTSESGITIPKISRTSVHNSGARKFVVLDVAFGHDLEYLTSAEDNASLRLTTAEVAQQDSGLTRAPLRFGASDTDWVIHRDLKLCMMPIDHNSRTESSPCLPLHTYTAWLIPGFGSAGESPN